MLDPELLAAALAQHDVYYLRTGDSVERVELHPPTLVAALAQHPLPRVREALIPLFLRHPEFSEFVDSLVKLLPTEPARVLRHFYTAAVYLQRLWWGKLQMYLGDFPLLPDHFGQSEWDLPEPEVHYGEAGLRVLAEKMKEETGNNWLSVYQSAVTLFFSQLKTAAHD